MRRIGSLMVQGSAICFNYQTAEESTVTKKNEELAASAGAVFDRVDFIEDVLLPCFI